MKVLIIDDDRLVCMSLATILESDKDIEVVGTGYDGSEAIKLFELKKPDVVLMDIRMQSVSGLEAAQVIIQSHPDARILFLTTFSDDEYIAKALRIGAKGYILKQHFEGIIPSIKAVCEGQRVFGDEVVRKIPAILGESGEFEYEKHGLTQKEFEIIEKVAQGNSNKEISELLYLSEGTVRNYISMILEKLQLRDRTQLAIFYYRNK